MDLAARLDAPLEAAAGGAGATRRGGRPPRGGGGDTTTPRSGTHSEVEAADGERMLKVGSETSSRRLAGTIAHAVREGKGVSLLPIGAACINQAVKGVAAARKYLSEEGIDLTCAPTFRDGTRKSVVLRLTAVKHSAEAPPPEEVTLSVAASSGSGALAGAVAAKVREELPVCLKCCGAVAVAQAIYALATARHYLSKDAVDIVCLPELVQEELSGEVGSGEPRTVLKLSVAVAAVGAVPLTLDGSATLVEGDGGDGDDAAMADAGVVHHARPGGGGGRGGGGRRPRAPRASPAAVPGPDGGEAGGRARGGGRGAPRQRAPQVPGAEPVRRGGRPPKAAGVTVTATM